MTEAAKKLSATDVQTIFDRSPFIGWLGLKVVSLDHDCVAPAELATRLLVDCQLKGTLRCAAHRRYRKG